jgi:alpha-amylase
MVDTSIRARLACGFAIAALALASSCSKQDKPATVAEVPAAPARSAFVHLFEWDWPSIALECEQFLGPAGYSAVQISPPQEHAVGPQWWTRYQPVSYQLTSRGGSREQFVDMVERCKAAGVGIYVDAVINHMTGVGSGKGVAGSGYGEYEYPPLYDYDDFNHCGRNEGDEINDFDDMWEVQNCELVNLADLRTDTDKVRETLAAYLNDLLSVGVAGLRIDAAKHTPPDDIAAILAMLDSDTYVFQEVIASVDGPVDRPAYLANADVTEFQYQPLLHRAFGDGDFDGLEKLGEEIGLLPSGRAVVFVDNHDSQRHDDGHSFNYKRGDRYVLANVFMLAWPYGYPKVMSSFDFDDRDAGAPGTTPIDAGSSSCNDGWVCEHRIPAIANMVAFRAATAGARVTNWQQHGDAAVSFGRADRGHVVINASEESLDVNVQTELEPGEYCDLFSGGSADACDGASVVVSDDRRLSVQLDPMTALAIHRSR